MNTAKRFRYTRKGAQHTSSECTEQDLKVMREAAKRQGRNWDDYFEIEEVTRGRKQSSMNQPSRVEAKVNPKGGKPKATRKKAEASK